MQSQPEHLAAEEVAVVDQRIDLPLSNRSAVLSQDHLEGGEDLLGHHWRQGVVVHYSRRVRPDEGDGLLGPGDVSAHSAETLREGAHQDVCISNRDQ